MWVCSQKDRRMFFFNYLYLVCSQIWLNLPMDHRHVGYITKLTPKASQKKKKTVGHYTTRHVLKKGFHVLECSCPVDFFMSFGD
jgi:hypothetical protein